MVRKVCACGDADEIDLGRRSPAMTGLLSFNIMVTERGGTFADPQQVTDGSATDDSRFVSRFLVLVLVLVSVLLVLVLVLVCVCVCVCLCLCVILPLFARVRVRVCVRVRVPLP